MGGLSFSNVPRPGALPACGTVRAAPFGDFFRLALVPGHDVDLVDLHLALQFHRRSFGNQPGAQLLRHGLHIRSIQAQFQGDLPVGKVQAHEVEAQHPHTQRLVVPGQHRAGQVIETACTGLAAIPLPARLRVVVAVADHCIVVAGRAPDAFRPTALAHEGKALRLVHQARKVDQVKYSHGKSSSREPVSYSRPRLRTSRP